MKTVVYHLFYVFLIFTPEIDDTDNEQYKDYDQRQQHSEVISQVSDIFGDHVKIDWIGRYEEIGTERSQMFAKTNHNVFRRLGANHAT